MSETTSRNTSGTCIRTYSNRTENNTLYTACSQADVETTNQQYFQLDYEKIKQEFRKGTDYMLICKLLQALRWVLLYLSFKESNLIDLLFCCRD